MTGSAFVDTSAIVAFFDRTDEHHSTAVKMMESVRKNRMRLIMSDYVFDEIITTACARINHETAVRIGEFILESAIVHLIWLKEDVKRKAWEYFKKRPDKDYSFTDCTSFILMNELKVTKHLSFDDHFNQAGFAAFS